MKAGPDFQVSKHMKNNNINYNITNEDSEDWEDDAELYYNGKWEDLLDLRLRKARSNPNDLYAQYYLGEAYNLNKKYNEAIAFMHEWHKKEPWNDDFKSVILDALFALGKNENDIEWVIKPEIVRISKDLVDKCYKYIKSKKKNRDIHDLYYLFLTEEYDGYLAFSKEDLIEALKKDGRFIFSEGVFPGISAIKK